MNKVERIKELTSILNDARNEYYNNSNSEITDSEYDRLFDELLLLEKETGVLLNNSPTQTVGYEVKSKLEKTTHNHPMLSLDKTKSVTDIINFLDGKRGVAMLKMDGLTCSNGYSEYELSSSETRGNGEIGEDIIHNSKTIRNLPLKIKVNNLIVDGEVIIDYKTFDNINSKLPEEEKYKTPRNLSSGSIRQLDSKIAASRNMKFIAWKVVSGIESNSFCERLESLINLGFEIVPYYAIKENITENELAEIIDQLKCYAEIMNLPIDGIVFGYDDVKYGESLGATGHHLRSQIAYKFYDELSDTEFLGVELKTSRYGIASITGLFNPVEIDGTTVSRASLHNVDIFNSLELGIGDRVQVYKANMIIPQISDNLDRTGTYKLPMVCPVCGNRLQVIKRVDTNELYCDNEDCKSRLLGKLTHFVSKPAMNIDGMSEATLEFLIFNGWVNGFVDLYSLDKYKSEWMRTEGFGKASVTKLLEAIDNSRRVKLENFLVGLGIPLIGKTASKDLSKFCNGYVCELVEYIESSFDFSTAIDGFGSTMNISLYEWFNNNKDLFMKLLEGVVIVREEVVTTVSNNKSLEGKSICITGKLIKYTNREALVKDIELYGGKEASGVTNKTDYLLTNDTTSGSSKNKKANELGIPIITEEQFLEMIG